MEKQRFLNTYISNANLQEVLQELSRFIETGKPHYVVEANVDVILKIEHDAHLKQIADEADLLLVDGQPLLWIANWQHRPIKEKISGSDFMMDICEMAAQKGYSIYFVGGGEGVAEKAIRNLQKRYPGLRSAGCYVPPLGFESDPEEVEKINRAVSAAKPDILFACLGCPKQELWVYQNREKCGAKVMLCLGAGVDFAAGTIKRAPSWMSRCGLEWFFRFTQEPMRLFRRYFVEDPAILKIIWKYRDQRVRKGAAQ